MEKIRQRQQEERRSPLGKLIKSPSEQNVLFWRYTKPNIPALKCFFKCHFQEQGFFSTYSKVKFLKTKFLGRNFQSNGEG